MKENAFSLPGWYLNPADLLSGILCLGLGIFFLLFPAGHAGGWGLFFIALGLYCLTVAVFCLGRCLCTVHFLPEGISLTLGKKAVFRLPTDRLRLLIRLMVQEGKQTYSLLVLSTHSREGLTLLREQQLQKSAVTRNELPFRKRKSGWEQALREEYLIRRRRHDALAPWQRDLLYFRPVPELPVILSQLYPQMQYEAVEKNLYQLRSDPDPRQLRRGLRPSTEGANLFLSILFGGGAVLFLYLSWAKPLIAVLSTLIFGGAAAMLWLSNFHDQDLFSLESSEIRIFRHQKPLKTIPKESLRTIVRLQRFSMGVPEPVVLLLCEQTPEQLLQEAMARRSRFRRSLYPMLNGAQRWQEIELHHYFSTARFQLRCQTTLDASPEREQTLRTLYPDAAFLNLVFEFPTL